MERFDNLTDEEVEDGIRKIKAVNPHRKKIQGILIAIVLIGILVIGYEIAPNYSLDRSQYLLSWLRG